MPDHQPDLYVPQDERGLRRVQRRVQETDRGVRAWADAVIDVLPRGLSLLEDETYILSLYLAQQRRLNLELDAKAGPETFRSRLSRLVPLLNAEEDDWEVVRAIHRMVAVRIESDLDRACEFFCRDRNIPAICDPSIDWRVSIRYMAQELHRIASQINLRGGYSTSPHRFELALRARDLAIEVAAKRREMITIFSADQQPV